MICIVAGAICDWFVVKYKMSEQTTLCREYTLYNSHPKIAFKSKIEFSLPYLKRYWTRPSGPKGNPDKNLATKVCFMYLFVPVTCIQITIEHDSQHRTCCGLLRVIFRRLLYCNNITQMAFYYFS